jgi:hypothetical protein
MPDELLTLYSFEDWQAWQYVFDLASSQRLIGLMFVFVLFQLLT